MAKYAQPDLFGSGRGAGPFRARLCAARLSRRSRQGAVPAASHTWRGAGGVLPAVGADGRSRSYRSIFPQMSKWLPEDEAEQLCFEFMRNEAAGGSVDRTWMAGTSPVMTGKPPHPRQRKTPPPEIASRFRPPLKGEVGPVPSAPPYFPSVSLTATASCLSEKGLGRKWNFSPSGRFLRKASSA